MRVEELGGDRGATANGAEEALQDMRAFEVQLRGFAFPDLFIVKAYDHLDGTVDVVPKANPNGSIFYAVPVQGMGGSLNTYYGFRTVDGKDAEPDVGWLVFPKVDSRRAFADFLRKVPPSSRVLQPFGATFFPGTPISSKGDPDTPNGRTIPPNVVASGPGKATEIAPKDKALVDPVTGSGIIIKADGNVVVVVAANRQIFCLKAGQDYGNATGVSLGGGPTDSASGTTKSS